MSYDSIKMYEETPSWYFATNSLENRIKEIEGRDDNQRVKQFEALIPRLETAINNLYQCKELIFKLHEIVMRLDDRVSDMEANTFEAKMHRVLPELSVEDIKRMVEKARKLDDNM